jgi:hypothetical protein
VVTTLGMTIVLGSVPRYYLMVLPLLLIEYALITKWIADRLARWRLGPTLALVYGLGFATVANVGQSAFLIMEQHGITRKLTCHSFLEAYAGGKMLWVVELSRTIAQNVPPGKAVLGPEPRMTTFLSGRPVYEALELLADRQHYPYAALMGDVRFRQAAMRRPEFQQALAERKDYSPGKMDDAAYWARLGRDKAFWRKLEQTHFLQWMQNTRLFWVEVLRERRVSHYVRQNKVAPKEKLMDRLLNDPGALLSAWLDRASEIHLGTMHLGRVRSEALAPAARGGPASRPAQPGAPSKE